MKKTFNSPEPKTKDEAREYAMNWQNWASNSILYYSDLNHWGNKFMAMANKFHLVREFKENGLI